MSYKRAKEGPFDIDEVTESDDVIDLGSLRIPATEDMHLRVEIEDDTQRLVGVTLDIEGSSLQLQAFAAPRTEGVWTEIREQIADSVQEQGGDYEVIDGYFGKELVVKLPVATGNRPAHDTRYRVARFIGVDGPRWFLRGVLAGDAALDRNVAASLEKLFRQVVVVRGNEPMAPRDLLPMTLPPDTQRA